MTIYLDYQATTPLAPEARDAMLPWLRDGHANPSGAHREAKRARDIMAAVDDALASDLNDAAEAFNMDAPVRLVRSFNTPQFMANAWPLNLDHVNKACSQKKCHEKKRFEGVGRGFMGHGLGCSCR